MGRRMWWSGRGLVQQRLMMLQVVLGWVVERGGWQRAELLWDRMGKG